MDVPLSQEQIEALLARKSRGSTSSKKPDVHTPTVARYLPDPQVGPIVWYDKEMRCVSSRCNSPTYLKFQGIPYCLMHTLKICNEMLIVKGVLS